MTRRKKISILVIGIVFVLLAIGIYHMFFDTSLENAPHGKLVEKLDSPNHEYTARVFRINEGWFLGATNAPSVRVDIVFNKNQNRQPKTIYYEYDRSYPYEVSWINSKEIKIYNHKLNVLKDTYNWKTDDNWDKERNE